MSYDIVAYCSSSHKDALSLCLGSWLESDAKRIAICTDFPIILENDSRIFHERMAPCNDFGENCTRKAGFAINYVRSFPSRNVVMLDVDCWIAKDLSSIFDHDFKVAVTVYPDVPIKKMFNNVSAGAIFFKKDRHFPFIFLQQWCLAQNGDHGPCRDQRTLSRLIKDRFSEHTLAFSVDQYNSHPITSLAGDIRQWIERIKKNNPAILHFAGQTWRNEELIDEIMEIVHDQK